MWSNITTKYKKKQHKIAVWRRKKNLSESHLFTVAEYTHEMKSKCSKYTYVSSQVQLGSTVSQECNNIIMTMLACETYCRSPNLFLMARIKGRNKALQ